jgi:GNAT superfamily N-acetyltransferase
MTRTNLIQSLHVRALEEAELANADRVLRSAFNTFVGVPDLFGDKDYLHTRFRADPEAAVVAVSDGELIGSNFATNWGSVGFFGPLSVRPDLWDRGVGAQLVDATMRVFDGWPCRHVGLFTFAHSAKHIGLYERFGFRPRFLTAIMSKPVATNVGLSPAILRYSELAPSDRTRVKQELVELTDAIYDGLDLTREVDACAAQHLGDCLIAYDGSRPVGLAVCHTGAGSEAGSNVAYVKFAGANPDARSADHFGRLLSASESFAAASGAVRLEVGVNLGCANTYDVLRARGFGVDWHGVAMHQPNEAGYHECGVFVADDWR